MSTKGAEPTLNMHQVVAAGLASTGAAFVTSRFGVAGTLLGAALTAMIITGGSAILKAYIESASTRVREMPTRIRSRGEGRQTAGPEGPKTMPGRPDLRNNAVGRMRAALDWFSNLPAMQRRTIIIKGLVAAAVAFAICMVAIWGVEKIIGNSLSCGFWGTCPVGAAPGIHLAGYDGTGAGSSLSGGDVGTSGGGGGLTPTGAFDGGRDTPVFGDNDGIRQPGNGGIGQPDSGQSVSPAPGADPGVDSGADPGADPGAEPGADSSASPAPEEPDPSSASPDAGPEEAPASASPAAGQ